MIHTDVMLPPGAREAPGGSSLVQRDPLYGLVVTSV
jgi:hypothetical protein